MKKRTHNQHTKQPVQATITAQEFENSGYSKADAARMANDPAKNWKASRGGERRNPYAPR